MNLPKVTKSRLSDKVTEVLYDQIRSGKLKAGDKLPSELELSEQLGVSRPSVREALNRLMGLGLIVRGTYTCSVAESSDLAVRSAFVPMLLNDWETRDLFEARRLVECNLVRLAVIKASPEDIAELRRVNEKMKRPNLSEQEYWDFDIEFHTTLASMSANTVMITVYDMISTMYHRYEGKVKKLYDVQMTTYSNHKALIEAIEEKDVEKACGIVNRSMSISEEAIYNLNTVTKK